MRRQVVVSMTVVGGLAMLMGCAEDPKKRIALLEQDNQRLMDELDQARGDSESARRDLDSCQQALGSARNESGRLASELAGMRNSKNAAPAPSAAPVTEGWVAVPGGAMIAIPGEVLFPSGKSELRTDARKMLDKIISDINNRYQSQDVLVFGHTDNEPIKKSGWKDNFELSAQRALSVVRYFQQTGVNPARMVAGGCGEYRPVAPNSSNSDKAKNRRVEVYALDAGVQTASR